MPELNREGERERDVHRDCARNGPRWTCRGVESRLYGHSRPRTRGWSPVESAGRSDHVGERSTADQSRPERRERAKSLAAPVGNWGRRRVPVRYSPRGVGGGTVRVAISEISGSTLRDGRSQGTNGGCRTTPSPGGTRESPRRRRIATPLSRDRHSHCPVTGGGRAPTPKLTRVYS